MAAIEKVEGIGPTFGAKLRGIGIATTGALLKKGATPAGRKAIVKDSGLTAKQILKFVNHVDLMRVKGVGEEYSELLEAAGVDTVPELAQRKADNLLEAMLKLNQKKKLVRIPPSIGKVKAWIDHAKKLPRVIEY
ncbi:MAG: DUF4332 domain-containing protein [Leptospiraceae bacterium]|nr:DUF4332 domain-containing protein [Leptospiraceae bacterium]MCB1201201.1 DUF4332 domain-containing protein [Leptospiraceae bacterium]